MTKRYCVEENKKVFEKINKIKKLKLLMSLISSAKNKAYLLRFWKWKVKNAHLSCTNKHCFITLHQEEEKEGKNWRKKSKIKENSWGFKRRMRPLLVLLQKSHSIAHTSFICLDFVFHKHSKTHTEDSGVKCITVFCHSSPSALATLTRLLFFTLTRLLFFTSTNDSDVVVIVVRVACESKSSFFRFRFSPLLFLSKMCVFLLLLLFCIISQTYMQWTTLWSGL